MSRVLAVDPGSVRIGLALSDPGGSIARPLDVLAHRSRAEDARAIAARALAEGAARIVVGVALDRQGEPGPAARRALRLIEALRACSDLPVEPWDESDSTRAAVEAGGQAPLDARAAAVVLQGYLDAQNPG